MIIDWRQIKRKKLYVYLRDFLLIWNKINFSAVADQTDFLKNGKERVIVSVSIAHHLSKSFWLTARHTMDSEIYVSNLQQEPLSSA